MRTRRALLHSLLPLVAMLLVAGSGALSGPSAQPAALAPPQERLREIYKELVEINTTDSAGDNTRAAEAMAARLRAAGFPAADVQVLAPAPRKGNLVARLRGTGARRPLLLLAHLDVVEAQREDWSMDPFKLLEQDGYFYGRGTSDDKAMAAIFDREPDPLPAGGLPARPRHHRGADRRRGGGARTTAWRWLLKKHATLIDAELALNEGGGRRA